MEYFLEINGESKGPYSRLQVQNMINNNIINSDNRIWCSDYEDWKKLSASDFDIKSIINYENNITPLSFNFFFFEFFKPYLNYIDNGNFFRKPFYWLYTAIAVIQFIFPLIVFFAAIKLDVFKAEGAIVFSFLSFWIILLLSSLLSFQIWWDRREKITYSSNINDEFVATPTFSHFIQTLGEWFGAYFAVIGFALSLFTTIFSKSDSYQGLNHFISMSFFDFGTMGMIIAPLSGFFIVVFSRFISEQIKVFTTIARNTEALKNKEI
ncbi:MAG: GYF domain-containing protein [Chitinophagales bacterium]|nr:GYF domain-containing protein [Chitinophagales bacterium]